MKIFNSLNDIPDNHRPSSITIGNFDGLHIGHIKLLENTIALAKKNNTIPVVLTFSPMPEEYFQNEYFFRLMNNTEKSEFIENYGIIVPSKGHLCILEVQVRAFFGQNKFEKKKNSTFTKKYV